MNYTRYTVRFVPDKIISQAYANIFFVSDDGSIFIPCGMLDDQPGYLALAAVFEGVTVLKAEDHPFVPFDWGIKKHPGKREQLQPVIENMRFAVENWDNVELFEKTVFFRPVERTVITKTESWPS